MDINGIRLLEMSIGCVKTKHETFFFLGGEGVVCTHGKGCLSCLYTSLQTLKDDHEQLGHVVARLPLQPFLVL